MEEKFLLIMRHAKSDWSEHGQSDFDRDLNERGTKAAPQMGNFLKESGFSPSTIISSPAKRAHRTTNLVVESAGLSTDIVHLNRSFYFGLAEDYHTALQEISSTTRIAMVVGHNPLVENFIGLMCNGVSSSLLQMPTAGIACIEFYGEHWNEFNPGSGRLKWFMIPKLIS